MPLCLSQVLSIGSALLLMLLLQLLGVLGARSSKAANRILAIFVLSGSICLQGWESELICIVKVISPVKRASFIFE